MNAIARVASLGPGDLVIEGYAVLDAGDTECLRPDTYRFEQEVEIEKYATAQIDSDVAAERRGDARVRPRGRRGGRLAAAAATPEIRPSGGDA